MLELVVCNGLSIWNSPVFNDSMMEGGIMPTLTSSPHAHVVLGYKDTPIRLGNVYDERFGQSFGGNVWDTDGVAPTLKTTAAASQQFVIEKKQAVVDSPNLELLGCLEGSFDTSTRVYSASGIAPTLAAAMGTGDNNVPLFMVGK